MKKNCPTCALNLNNQCALFHFPTSPSTYCSYHRSEITICEKCNAITLAPIFTPDGKHVYCENCASNLTHCDSCISNKIPACPFETDPSPLPLRLKNGERNPLRIQTVCTAAKCPCLSPVAPLCLHDYGGCHSFHSI